MKPLWAAMSAVIVSEEHFSNRSSLLGPIFGPYWDWCHSRCKWRSPPALQPPHLARCGRGGGIVCAFDGAPSFPNASCRRCGTCLNHPLRPAQPSAPISPGCGSRSRSEVCLGAWWGGYFIGAPEVAVECDWKIAAQGQSAPHHASQQMHGRSRSGAEISIIKPNSSLCTDFGATMFGPRSLLAGTLPIKFRIVSAIAE